MTLCIDEFDGDDKTFYNAWLAYCNLIIGNIYASNNYDIYSFLTDLEDEFGDKDFDNLQRYIQIKTDRCDKKITNNLKKDDLICLDIKSFYLSIFLTLLIDNACKHGDGKIIINSSKNSLSILNEILVENIDLLKTRIKEKMIKEPWLYIEEENSPGITLFSLNQIFNKEYILSIDIINNFLTIEIKKDEQ